MLRAREDKPGLLALSRFDPTTGEEVLIAFNTSTTALDRQVEIGTDGSVVALAGTGCAPQPTAPGSLHVRLAPFGYAVCRIGGAR